MLSQIFKKYIDKQILFDFLDKIAAQKFDTKYIFDNTSYKKAHLLEIFDSFIEEVKPYYHSSKLFYTEKKASYKMLSTIIRQICRLNGLYYKQEIKYAKSTYEIIYHIYLPDQIYTLK